MQQLHANILPSLLDKLSEGIVYQNAGGEIIYANLAASTILGLNFEQLPGTSAIDPKWKTIYPDGSPFPGENHPAMIVLKTGNAQLNVIMGVYKQDGSLSWISIDAYPVVKEKENAVSVVSSFTDITKQWPSSEKLKQSEQHQRAILLAIKEGFYLVDQNLRIIVINKAAIELHTQTFKKHLTEGDNILDLFPPDNVEYIKNNFQKAFAGEKIEYEVKYPGDDAVIWFMVTYSPVTNADGEIIYVCIGINDITNKKMAELQLINSEKRFREVLSNLGDNVWEHDFRTGKTYFSERFNDLAGYDSNGSNDIVTVWWNSTHEEDRWMLEENDSKYKEGLIDHHTIEYRILHKDGSVRWVLDRGVVIEKDTDGKPLKIIGTHTDVTKRRQDEDEIKANEAKFRAIFNSTFQFMGLMTIEGILIEANQTATDFFRILKEEVMGTNFVDSMWFSESTREKSKQALMLAAKGETVNYELELNLSDGKHVVIDFSIRPILDAKGKVILLIPEGRDITDKLRMVKEMEQERISKQKEIVLASIEGQEKQRKEVARELHDNINQVLATIKIYLQLAGENENMRDGLIAKSYENISHAIEEVRKLSKALAPPTLDDISLVEALQQMVNDMAISKLFEIEFLENSFDEALLDNLQKMTVYRVVQEQFTNILKYARAKKITISLLTSDDEITLVVNDDGVGFDPLTRSTGIGIKNMQSRVELHNGQFNLKAYPGKGCKLTVTLPIIKTLSNAENQITDY